MKKLENVCILHVDPDFAFQEAIKRLFPPSYRILPAPNLAEASTMLLVDRPSVVLIELNMPEGDSLSWIRDVRLYATRRQLTIICVTHRSSVRDKVDGFSTGADDYIVKPIDPLTFLTRVKLQLRIRQIATTYREG